MFDVGFSELLLLSVVALVVLGPEKLPHAARMAGAWVGRIRRMLMNVQAEIENEVSASEMRERIRKEMAKAKDATGLQDLMDAVHDNINEISAPAQNSNTPAAYVTPPEVAVTGVTAPGTTASEIVTTEFSAPEVAIAKQHEPATLSELAKSLPATLVEDRPHLPVSVTKA